MYKHFASLFYFASLSFLGLTISKIVGAEEELDRQCGTTSLEQYVEEPPQDYYFEQTLIVISGPPSSGKSSLIEYILKLNSYEFAVINKKSIDFHVQKILEKELLLQPSMSPHELQKFSLSKRYKMIREQMETYHQRFILLDDNIFLPKIKTQFFFSELGHKNIFTVFLYNPLKELLRKTMIRNYLFLDVHKKNTTSINILELESKLGSSRFSFRRPIILLESYLDFVTVYDEKPESFPTLDTIKKTQLTQDIDYILSAESKFAFEISELEHPSFVGAEKFKRSFFDFESSYEREYYITLNNPYNYCINIEHLVDLEGNLDNLRIAHFMNLMKYIHRPSYLIDILKFNLKIWRKYIQNMESF